jgi:hypothetical protein
LAGGWCLVGCRHGDEQKLCSLMGVMQGIFSFVTSGGDDLRYYCPPCRLHRCVTGHLVNTGAYMRVCVCVA